MNDLSRSERRLIVALDRLDYTVERAGGDLTRLRSRPAVAPPPPAAPAAAHPGSALQSDNRRLSDEVVALHDRQAATLEAMRERLAEAQERLAGAGEHMARLAAANDGLSAANRDLIAAADGGAPSPDTVRTALEAEIESLRAARAAEIAQMGEILDALDRMLGTPAPAPRKPARTDDGAGVAGETDADRISLAASEFRKAGAQGSMSTATEVAAPVEVMGDAGGLDAGPDEFADDAGLPGTDEALDRELVVERDELPEDDVSLFGGVYDDDTDENDPDDTEGDRR